MLEVAVGVVREMGRNQFSRGLSCRLKVWASDRTRLWHFPSYLLSPQVKKTLYTFWILKVTLRDKTNSNSNCGPQNQCDLRGVLYYAVRLARKSLIILAKIFRLFRSSIFWKPRNVAIFIGIRIFLKPFMVPKSPQMKEERTLSAATHPKAVWSFISRLIIRFLFFTILQFRSRRQQVCVRWSHGGTRPANHFTSFLQPR